MIMYVNLYSRWKQEADLPYSLHFVAGGPELGIAPLRPTQTCIVDPFKVA